MQMKFTCATIKAVRAQKYFKSFSKFNISQSTLYVSIKRAETPPYFFGWV